MKPKLKLAFTDTHEHIAAFFYTVLSAWYDVTLDEKTPAVLIFGDENFGTTNLNYRRGEVLKIFYTGENKRPENYDCDYAISFDHNFSPWHYRLPLYLIYMWSLKSLHNLPYEFNHIFHMSRDTKASDKEGFASFVVSNPGPQERIQFFDLLNERKGVASPGKVRNNWSEEVVGEQAKIDFLNRYKFNICFEAASNPGYVTEKILHAYYARTIPIYWGSQTIGVDFNPVSMINVHSFKSFEECVDFVMKVDSDDNLFETIVNQPKFMYNIPPAHLFLDNFLCWFSAVMQRKLKGRPYENTYLAV